MTRGYKDMEFYEVVLMNLETGDESTIQVNVDEAESSENFIITAEVNGQKITASNYNYFPAYQKFRDKLLHIGYGVKCNGSRLNAVQSGMMGSSDLIYLVEMGKQSQKKDIVHIWDKAEIDVFPDTKQQDAFFEQWSKM